MHGVQIKEGDEAVAQKDSKGYQLDQVACAHTYTPTQARTQILRTQAHINTHIPFQCVNMVYVLR